MVGCLRKTPIRDRSSSPKYAIFVDDNTNFYDLIELSDAVAFNKFMELGVYSYDDE